MRVVVDTNVLVSRLLIAGSVSARAVDRAIAQAEVVISEATMSELADVLARNKLDRYISINDRQGFILRFMRVATLVPVISEIDDCPDPADNHFLALAHDAQAEFIITGDKALLSLHPWRGIVILTPSDFLKVDIEE